MITYQEYYQRMKTIENALNALNSDSLPHTVINPTGLSAHSVSCAHVGNYFNQLIEAAPHLRNVAHQLFAELTYLIKSGDMQVDFAMFDVEDVEGDASTEQAWFAELDEYARMTPSIFIGAAASSVVAISIDTNGDLDLAYWAQSQAAHLAAYCVTHDINVVPRLQNL